MNRRERAVIGLLLAVMAFWMVDTARIATADSEVYPTGSEADTVVMTARYIQSGVTAAGRDTTQFALTGSGASPVRYGLLYGDISGVVPSNHAIIAAHVRIVVNKATLPAIAVRRIVNEWTPTQVSFTNRKTATAWVAPGLGGWLERYATVGGAIADTLYSTTSYDAYANQLLDAGYSGGSVTAGQALLLDVTDAVRRWHSGHWANYGFLVTHADTTTDTPGGSVRWGSYATTADRPRLIVQHVAVGESGSAILGKGGRGIRQ